MYPFIGSPLNFGAMRFGPQMGVQGMNGPITAAQLMGVQGFGNQSMPIQPRQFPQAPQVPQMAPQQPMQQPQMMPQRPMGLLSRDFNQGGRGNGGMGAGRGGGFGGGQGPQHGPGSGGSRSGRF